MLAFWMQQFAVGWLVVELAVRDGEEGNAALYLGLVGFARAVPVIAFGLVGGVLADRFDRKRTMLTTRAALVTLSTILAALTLSGLVSLPAVMIVAALSGLVFTVDAPTRMASASMLTGPADAFSAISITRSIVHTASLIGPVIAGFLIVPFGVGGVLALIAVIDAAGGLGIQRLPSMPAEASVRLVKPWQSMREGFAHVASRPTLRGLVIVNVVLTVSACAYLYLLPAVAHDTLGVGVVEVSWLVGASGLGAVTGSMLLTTMGSWRRPGRVLVGSAIALAVAVIALGLARDLLPAILTCAVLGVLTITYYGGSGNMLQISVPNHLRGRVLAFHSTIYLGGTQVGTLVIGGLGAVLGISNAILVAGIVSLGVALAMSRVAAIRDAAPPRPEETIESA